MAIIVLFMDSLQVNFEVDDINNLPKYCDFHKFFLVEELVLQDDYTRIHYGKCRVIGRLISINGDFFLENIQITNLDKCVFHIK